MRFLAFIVIVVALASATFAQDLDSPRCGTAAQQAVAAHSSLFDQMLAKLMQSESDYLDAGQVWSAEWAWESQWLISEGFLFWNNPDALAYYQQFDQLSVAEQTAWHIEVAASRARMVAAGLN